MESRALLRMRSQVERARLDGKHSCGGEHNGGGMVGLHILSWALHMDSWPLHLGQNPATILWLVRVWEDLCEEERLMVIPTCLVGNMEI